MTEEKAIAEGTPFQYRGFTFYDVVEGETWGVVIPEGKLHPKLGFYKAHTHMTREEAAAEILDHWKDWARRYRA